MDITALQEIRLQGNDIVRDNVIRIQDDCVPPKDEMSASMLALAQLSSPVNTGIVAILHQ